MRNLTLCLAVALVACSAQAQPKTEDEKTLYALGASIGQSLSTFNLQGADLEMVKRGMTDAVQNKTLAVELSTYQPKIEDLARRRAEAKLPIEKKKGQEYADAFAKEKGAVKLEKGAVIKDITPGTGASPAATDTVKVHYKGTLINGQKFDSSYDRKQPAEFPLNGVIPCWTEAVQKMKVGGKAKVVCPSDIAYGDHGRPPKIPGGATLVFEIELLDIVKKDAPATPPAAPAAPPSQPKK